MKKSLGFPVLSFLGCGGLSHVSLLSLAWNASGPRVSSRQFGQLTLLCQLSDQVDVMVMVFGHNCDHDLGQGQGTWSRDMVMVTDMVVAIVVGIVLVTVVVKLLIDS